MTVIRPNGISGITSITSSGDAINFFKSDGTLGPVLGLNINATSGISTFAALNVTGVLTYEDVTSVDSVGIITARSDLSIADKIIHTGDTNTAIRFPAADTVTVETGGAERLRITSGGDLSLGNSSVAFPSGSGLQVYHASAPRIKLTNSTTGVGSGDGSYLYVTGNDFLIENKESANMRFYTSATERLRIDSAGRLLLGTTTEGHADADDLTLQAPSGYTGITLRSGTTTGGAIYFSDATSGNGEIDGQIVYSQNSRTMTFATAGVTKLTLKSDGLLVPKGIQASANVTPTSGNGVEVFAPTSSVGQIQAYDRDNSQWNDFIIKGQTIQVHANGSERLRIDGSGNLGINNNNPSQRVHVGGNIELNAYDNAGGGGGYNTSNGLIIGNLYDAGKSYSGSDDRTACIWQERGLDLDFATNNTLRMKLTYDGKLKLGTASPKRQLHLNGGNETVKIQITNSTTGSANDGEGFQIGIAANGDAFLEQRENSPLIFYTNNTEAMRLDSSRRLLVGTSTPGDAAADNLTLHSSGDTGITIRASETGSSSIYFADGAGGTNVYTGAIIYDHATNHMSLHTNSGAERVRIDTNGRMGVGTNSPSNKLHAADSVTTPIRVQSTAQGTVYLRFQNTNNARGYVGYESKRLAFYTDNGSDTGDTRVAFMDADGLKFFNDTAETNALDDYEEGTFTPSIYSGSR